MSHYDVCITNQLKLHCVVNCHDHLQNLNCTNESRRSRTNIVFFIVFKTLIFYTSKTAIFTLSWCFSAFTWMLFWCYYCVRCRHRNVFRTTVPLWGNIPANVILTCCCDVHLILAWTEYWTKNHDAGDLRRNNVMWRPFNGGNSLLNYPFIAFDICLTLICRHTLI